MTVSRESLPALLDERTALGAHFLAAVTQARERYPELELPLEAFANRVQALLETSSSDTEGALRELHVDDLYLAYACGLGKPEALSLFDARYLQPLRTFLPDFDRSEPKLDELKQIVRERLLLGAPGAPPRIMKYAGRGSLAAWVQVAAQRLAISSLRRHVADAPAADDALVDLAALGPDPEFVQLRLQYAPEFREAFCAALDELTARERLLLKMHLVEGISLTRIAVSYRISQSTASRWFSQIRERLLDETKRRLQQQIGVNSAEFDSIARLLQSQLDVSLSRLLGSAPGGGDAREPREGN